MTKREPFRVGVILGPQNGIHSLGVTHGDWDKGCEFLQSARPLITDFVDQFQAAYAKWTEKPVSLIEERKR
jgi:hypothetical protein